MDEGELRELLSGLPIPDLRWHARIDSTNSAAMDWALQNAGDGCLVAADAQTAGRGRLGRKWVTHPAAGLAFSLVLRPTASEREWIGLFSPLGAIAVATALDRLGLEAQVKWPNDVLLLRRKVSGILVESIWSGEALDALVLGIGINVASSSLPPAEDLLFPAVCVEEVFGRPVERWQLLRATLEAFFAWRPRLGSPEFMTAWQSRLAFVGEDVSVSRVASEPFHGTLLGVDGQGNLQLRLPDGQEAEVLTGDVSLRPEEKMGGGYVR